jgi:hypothetical protein
MIFESAKTPGKTWFIVNPFKEIVNKQDPWRDCPDLKFQLVQTKHEVTEVILSERIIGHVAVLLNPASVSPWVSGTNNQLSGIGHGGKPSHLHKQSCVDIELVYSLSIIMRGGRGRPMVICRMKTMGYLVALLLLIHKYSMLHVKSFDLLVCLWSNTIPSSLNLKLPWIYPSFSPSFCFHNSSYFTLLPDHSCFICCLHRSFSHIHLNKS